MGLFDKFKELTVNEGINLVRGNKNALLLDIRPKEEFKKGHVAGAVNIPMDRLDLVKGRIPDKDTTVYVVGDYHHSQKKAAKELKKMGYTSVYPSGSMEDHHGILKR